jgi:hypothetical protein
LGIIQGDLARKFFEKDADLAKTFGEPSSSPPESPSSYSVRSFSPVADEPVIAWYGNSLKVAPGHYIRFLVDRQSNFPSPNQLLTAIETTRAYIQVPYDLDLGLAIDNTSRETSSSKEDIARGRHFFLCSKGENGRSRSQVRVSIIEKFCNAVQARLQQVPTKLRDEPDSRALSYSGYAASVAKRTAAHESDNTSYLMGLLSSVFRYHKFAFEWDDFITSYAVNADEARIGEMLINGLAQSYSDSSWDVAVHPAGGMLFPNGGSFF